MAKLHVALVLLFVACCCLLELMPLQLLQATAAVVVAAWSHLCFKCCLMDDVANRPRPEPWSCNNSKSSISSNNSSSSRSN
jgi:hypothetical protein